MMAFLSGSFFLFSKKRCNINNIYQYKSKYSIKYKTMITFSFLKATNFFSTKTFQTKITITFNQIGQIGMKK